MAEAFIKIHRKMLDWEWYKDTNTFCLFLHCLLIANWKDGKFMGYEIPRGSFVSSYSQLAQQTSMSIQNVRTAINHLKSTGELTVNSHTKFSVFTVVNYNRYQDDNRQANKQLTNNQQATNKQLTTIEEYKEYKEKEEVKEVKNNNKRFVPPTVEEVRSYCKERNNGINAERFIDFYEAKGWMLGKNKMKDWKAAVRTWEGRENGSRNTGNTRADEEQRNREIDEVIRRQESGEADNDDDGLW